MIDLDNGTRRTVLAGERWSTSHMFLDEQSLILWLFDSPNINTYVSFRANLSDVLALPAD